MAPSFAPSLSWQWISTPSIQSGLAPLQMVSVASASNIWAIANAHPAQGLGLDTSAVLQYVPGSQPSWNQVPGPWGTGIPLWISASTTAVAVVDPTGNVLVQGASGWSSLGIPSNAGSITQVACYQADKLLALDTNGALWQYNSGWSAVPIFQKVNSVAIATDGTVAFVSGNALHSGQFGASTYPGLPLLPSGLAPASLLPISQSGGFVGLTADGYLWDYDSSAWKVFAATTTYDAGNTPMLPGSTVAQAAVGEDSTLWMVTNHGTPYSLVQGGN